MANTTLDPCSEHITYNPACIDCNPNRDQDALRYREYLSELGRGADWGKVATSEFLGMIERNGGRWKVRIQDAQMLLKLNTQQFAALRAHLRNSGSMVEDKSKSGAITYCIPLRAVPEDLSLESALPQRETAQASDVEARLRGILAVHEKALVDQRKRLEFMEEWMMGKIADLQVRVERLEDPFVQLAMKLDSTMKPGRKPTGN